MYYTSCERGLSGFSGFQFNAVSAGVTTETMHAVEALAGYDPPRSLVESETPEQLARCPVAFSFVREEASGGPADAGAAGGPAAARPLGAGATAVHVRYVGRDSARRFGNYFAHALHTEDFAAAGGGLLAIELWNSPVWTTRVAQESELPPLDAPPPCGPLNSRTVQAFLRAQPDAHRLTELLAAVFTALGEDRSVVVVDRTTDRIAHWFAAVSYLLPPPLARRLSFSTYLFRPTRGRLHLIGCVPEAKPEIGPDDQDAYTLFDFAAGRFPDGVPVHHLVRLLTRIGLASIRSVWSWAAEYTHGGERHPGDWHPPVAAAAAGGGIPLAPEDVAAVLDWLPTADHLGARRAVVARDIRRSRPDLSQAQLRILSAAARAGGDTALHRELEGALQESRMRAYLAGADDAVAPVPLADTEERERAVRLWRSLLPEAGGVRQRVRHLLWAYGAGLDLPGDVLRETCGELARVLLESATGRSPDPALRGEVRRLLRTSGVFRGALVAALDALVAGREGHHQLFSQFPADLLDARDLEGRPVLQEHHWLARAEREPGRGVEVMFRILALRGQDVPDPALLRGLWRQPPWTHREAIEIARRLPGGGRADAQAVLGAWFERTVLREVVDEARLADFLELCAVLAAPEWRPWLTPDTRETVEQALALARLLREADDAGRLADAFAGPTGSLPAPIRTLRDLRLVDALTRAPADPRRVPRMVGGFGFSLADRYLRAVLDTTTAAPRHGARPSGRRAVDRVLLGHVAGLALAYQDTALLDRLPHQHRQLVADVFAHAVRYWPAEDVERLAATVRPILPSLADGITEQRTTERRKGVRWLPLGRGRQGPTDRPGEGSGTEPRRGREGGGGPERRTGPGAEPGADRRARPGADSGTGPDMRPGADPGRGPRTGPRTGSEDSDGKR
ncbi:GTPase-associated protein 1-related protein [Streptomyces sp. NPDC008121]|uniref:GTPase-associated protein 1-related protein n=1 Tax=Streptomyces sp. NPDC008121 TaxID=3364809 RepID=UPI0036EE3D41